MRNYGLMEGELPWPQEMVTTSNSSQANGNTPIASLDMTVVGDLVDIDEIEYTHVEATIEEMIDDGVKIGTGHGDMTEQSQAKRCCNVEHLSNHMIEPAQGEDATVPWTSASTPPTRLRT